MIYYISLLYIILYRTDVYLYVLDKDGNLVSASTVAEILRAGYSDRQAALFKKYGVVDGDPRAEVRISQCMLQRVLN